jgi:hypothetical protein
VLVGVCFRRVRLLVCAVDRHAADPVALRCFTATAALVTSSAVTALPTLLTSVGLHSRAST